MGTGLLKTPTGIILKMLADYAGTCVHIDPPSVLAGSCTHTHSLSKYSLSYLRY